MYHFSWEFFSFFLSHEGFVVHRHVDLSLSFTISLTTIIRCYHIRSNLKSRKVLLSKFKWKHFFVFLLNLNVLLEWNRILRNFIGRIVAFYLNFSKQFKTTSNLIEEGRGKETILFYLNLKESSVFFFKGKKKLILFS